MWFLFSAVTCGIVAGRAFMRFASGAGNTWLSEVLLACMLAAVVCLLLATCANLARLALLQNQQASCRRTWIGGSLVLLGCFLTILQFTLLSEVHRQVGVHLWRWFGLNGVQPSLQFETAMLAGWLALPWLAALALYTSWSGRQPG